MRKLTTTQVINLHSQLIRTTGGLDGVRDLGLVESAINSAFEVYFGVKKYPTLEEKAARLCYALVKNHGFLDGNKRIGVLTMMVFLEINGIQLKMTDKEIIQLGLGVAASKLNYKDILNFINQHK